ncbi:MAG: glutamate racemase [Coprococcus sp.]|nr:glutamate racemase [Coprococcus sp.]
MKIGIFDSGIGGLSVLHLAMKMMPCEEFLYYADESHVPYGEKTEEEILRYVKENLDFLVSKGAEAIVIACNTATSVATKEFRSRFPVPIVGMEPAVKKALELYRDEEKRILVAATPVTIAGDKLHDLLERVDRGHEADLVSLPWLVRFAEKGEFSSREVDDYLKEELGAFDLAEYSALVLGCTHFNYFKERFRHVFPNPVHFVDGNEGTVRQLLRVLPGKPGTVGDGKVSYYFSGRGAYVDEKERLAYCLKQLERVYYIQ